VFTDIGSARKDQKMERSMFASAFQNLIGARERAARRTVAHYLLGLDDTTLKALGKSRKEISERTF
jgi:hypothetical protein